MEQLSNKQATESDPSTGRRRLLELPIELQLAIYELVVQEDKVLLLNVPCNSSYRKEKWHYKSMRADQEAWRVGDMHPPKQPNISRTCRFIRKETLPMFYGLNVFRACYCLKDRMLNDVIRWLKIIGPKNRELLKHFYFYDRNERQDVSSPRALKYLQGSAVVAELGGCLEDVSSKDYCAHWVTFGDLARKTGQVALAQQLGTKALRIEVEI